MYPKLFDIPLGPLDSLPVNSYGFMVMLGFLAAIIVTVPRGRKDGYVPENIMDLAIVLVIAGIVGARINYVIVFHNEFSWRLFDISKGLKGLDVLGMVIGWLLPLAYYLWFMKRKRKADDSASPTAGKPPAARLSALTLRSFLLKLVVLILICCAVGVCLGRIVWVFRHPAGESARFTKYDDWGIFKVWQGGIIFYGGLIAAFIFGAFYARKRRFGVWKVGDLVMPAVALGLAFGRLGCFLNGCCFGIPVESTTFSVRYPRRLGELGEVIGSPAFEHQFKNGLVAAGDAVSLPVIPIQLIESLVCVAMFLLLSAIWRHKMRKQFELRVHGLVAAYLGLFYSATRFVLEFWRGDNERYASNLTFSQFMSIGVFALSFLVMCFLQHKKIVTKRETLKRWREQGLVK
jgi:phosphatidylglycerol:prolipoprotein diacylglycerol transferase